MKKKNPFSLFCFFLKNSNLLLAQILKTYNKMFPELLFHFFWIKNFSFACLFHFLKCFLTQMKKVYDLNLFACPHSKTRKYAWKTTKFVHIFVHILRFITRWFLQTTQCITFIIPLLEHKKEFGSIFLDWWQLFEMYFNVVILL